MRACGADLFVQRRQEASVQARAGAEATRVAAARLLAMLALAGVCCMGNPASAEGKTADIRKDKPSATYYVSARSGNDANDGLSARSAWQTLARVNAASLRPGDSVLFRRGDLWRGQLAPVSGDATGPVTYGAYGKGTKPRLLGSVPRNSQTQWQELGGNVWQTGDIPADVGNIVLDGGAATGVKVWSRADVDRPCRFWYDRDHAAVTMYCEENPAKRYSSIECALTRHIIDEDRKSYVTYRSLDLRYGGAHGIGGGGTSHIVVRDCDFSYIGGGHQFTTEAGEPVRYGNGVEFWDSAHDNLVEGCRLWEIYDAALTNQGSGTNTQANICYRNNVIWNCEYSFEYWNRPEASITRDIHFENNTCVNAGHGWGHSQRPDPSGRHLMFYNNSAKTSSFYVRNNIFYQIQKDAECCLDLHNDWSAGLTMDHNCWYQPSGRMIRWVSDAYTMTELPTFLAKTGKDAGSVGKDPHFANVARRDFSLAPDSPVRRLAAYGCHAGALP